MTSENSVVSDSGVADPLFEAAFPYADDVLDLPVSDLDEAAAYYGPGFGLSQVERTDERVVMQRDGVRLGFAKNGRDPEQEGAAIRVTDLDRARRELTAGGVAVGDERIDEREDGHKLRVFFVVAPDGLCFYFHAPLAADGGELETP